MKITAAIILALIFTATWGKFLTETIVENFKILKKNGIIWLLCFYVLPLLVAIAFLGNNELVLKLHKESLLIILPFAVLLFLPLNISINTGKLLEGIEKKGKVKQEGLERIRQDFVNINMYSIVIGIYSVFTLYACSIYKNSIATAIAVFMGVHFFIQLNYSIYSVYMLSKNSR